MVTRRIQRFTLLVCIGFAGQPVRGDESVVLRAGAAVTDITPDLGVSLDGPISKNGPAIGVHDPLHARALVLDDGNSQVALVICDACVIGRDVFDAAKAIVTSRTELPAERMLMAATHTHSAVRATHVGTNPIDDKYHSQLARRIADAVIRAQQNLAPARIGFGSFDNNEFVRCRRFLCEPGSVAPNPFGQRGERIKSVAGTSSAVIEPAGPVDPQFSVMSVQYADGKPLAILGNYSVHYAGGFQRGWVSADYFGHYATALESHFDAGPDHPPFVAIMSNGTSGNTGAVDRGEVEYAPFECMKLAARALAEDTRRRCEQITYRDDVTLDAQTSDLDLAVRRPDETRIDWARQTLADPDASLPHPWTRVYAQEALHLHEYPPTMNVKLQAIRIGDTAIAAIPCEVFAETGLAIKQQSPHTMTFTISLANGYGGYLPPSEQHALGGYETWPARSSFLEERGESLISMEIVRLLRGL